ELDLGKLDGLVSDEDVEAAAISSQQRKIIARAMDTLSAKEREAIVLRDLQGLSTEQVAAILGSTVSTVRSQINSARKKIKRYHDGLMHQRPRLDSTRSGSDRVGGNTTSIGGKVRL